MSYETEALALYYDVPLAVAAKWIPHALAALAAATGDRP